MAPKNQPTKPVTKTAPPAAAKKTARVQMEEELDEEGGETEDVEEEEVEEVEEEVEEEEEAPTPKKGTAVAKRSTQTTALSVGVGMDLLLEDAGGDKGFTKDDLAIPFLRVLQKGSPQVNKRDDLFIEGAEAGMFLDTLTGDIFDGESTGVLIVPCFFTRSYTEWKTRKAGGGFIRDHGANAAILNRTTRNEDNQDILKDNPDHQITTAFLYYVLLVDEETGEFRQLAFPLSGTQIKKGRKWNTLMQGLQVARPDRPGTFNPAPFYMSYRFTTVYESNDKGDWMGVSIANGPKTLDLPDGEMVYLAAREFRKLCESGAVRTTQPVEEIVMEAEEVQAATSGKREF